MTFEERLTELGVDLSDLPDYDEKLDDREKTLRAICVVRENSENERFSLLGIILRLTDIIDRMETRLVNLTGELDWLRIKCCDICGLRPEYGEEVCETCDVNRGVPTNWRPRSEPTRTNEEASPAVPDLTKTKE